MKAGKGVGDPSVAVFHVNDDEVIASEASDLGEGGREAEEKETVKGFAVFEAGF